MARLSRMISGIMDLIFALLVVLGLTALMLGITGNTEIFIRVMFELFGVAP